ncbi:DUF6585 family protein, partial [Thermogemmatispora sp.]|uniref:DUF6585 family protein n=1 Tax=Thermogemmatispora sp. TaxID=1968838 RepID=UPI003A10143B
MWKGLEETVSHAFSKDDRQTFLGVLARVVCRSQAANLLPSGERRSGDPQWCSLPRSRRSSSSRSRLTWSERPRALIWACPKSTTGPRFSLYLKFSLIQVNLLYILLGYLIIFIILNHNNILEELYELLIIFLFLSGVLLTIAFMISPLALLKYVLCASWGVYVYDRGLVYKRGRLTAAWRWDQITALWREVREESRMVAAGDSFVHYTETRRLY